MLGNRLRGKPGPSIILGGWYGVGTMRCMDLRSDPLRITRGDMPLVAAAIHAGHALRDDLLACIALDGQERLREEDPYTDRWVDVSDTTLVGLRSRFEFDLNRAPAQAVYLRPEDAWGLDVWRRTPDAEAVARSRHDHAQAYAAIARWMDGLIERHGSVVVYDIHSYNHQRAGRGVFAPVASDPDVNLGTAHVDRGRWDEVIDLLAKGLARPWADGFRPVVGENVKFKGGHFTQWLHERYGERVCAVAIEFKKVFMDEWTGVPDEVAIREIHRSLAGTVPAAIRHCHALATG